MKLRRVRSNWMATSAGDLLSSPAEIALSLPPINPVVTSPTPHRAKPAARNRRKTFIIGDFTPPRIAPSIGSLFFNRNRHSHGSVGSLDSMGSTN